MSDASSDFRRYDDAQMLQFSKLLQEQGENINDVKRELHQMEIHLAELKAIQTGRVEQNSYRIDNLEKWRDSTNRYMIGLVITLLTGFSALFMQQWFNAAMSAGSVVPK